MKASTTFTDYTNFELYLEGVRVYFSSITIREVEGGFPTASINLVATSGLMQTLPRTIVQLFGPDPLSSDLILLFEGEIVASAYRKDSMGGRVVSFNVNSLLDTWGSIRAHPVDSIMTTDYRKALTGRATTHHNLTMPKESTDPTIEVPPELSSLRSLLEVNLESTDGKLEDFASDISFTQKFNFSDEAIILLGKKEVVKGDLSLFINLFLKRFESYDAFYGLTANSFKLSPSVFTFPNVTEMIKAFKNKAVMSNILNISSGMNNTLKGGSLLLTDAINMFLQTFHYKMIIPSSPTGAFNFWASSNQDSRQPVRTIFLPDLMHSPPARCNVLFPGDVTSFSFSREFINECTRTIGTTSDNQYSPADLGVAGSKSFVVEPSGIGFDDYASLKNSSGLTLEETYKGIKLNFAEFDSFFTHATRSDKSGKAGSTTDEDNRLKEESKTLLNELTEAEHYSSRLATRTASFTTTWNPYRMVGLPGAYIEDDEGPSITGVINGITSVISSSGGVTSSISMRACRIIEDVRNDDQLENKEILNSFTTDMYPNINSLLHDRDMYDFKLIGKEVYPFITEGVFDKKGRMAKLISDGDVFKSGQNKFNTLQETSSEDASIFFYLDKDKKGIPIVYLGDNEDSRESTNNTKLVFQGIYALKDKYNSLKNSTPKALRNFTLNVTRRQIIRKGEYAASIGAFLDIKGGLDHNVNYKNVVLALRASKDIEKIKRAIEAHGNTSLESRSPFLLNPLTKIEGLLEKLQAIDSNIKELEQPVPT